MVSSTSVPSCALDGLGAGAELGHGRAEGTEVVDHGLVDQHVAVGQKEDAFLPAGLPQPPDDLEGGVGLAGAGGHDQQDAVLPLGDGFDGRVDGVALVVARLLAAAVVVVVLQDDLLLAQVAAPSRRGIVPRAWQGWGNASRARLVSQLADSCRCGRERQSRRRWTRKRKECRGLRRSRAPAACRRRRRGCCPWPRSGRWGCWLVVEDVIGPLGLAAGDQLAAHDDAALGENDFLANLHGFVPAGLYDGGRDELGADVTFAEVFLVHHSFFKITLDWPNGARRTPGQLMLANIVHIDPNNTPNTITNAL